MLPILYVYRNCYANSECLPYSNYAIVKRNAPLDIVKICYVRNFFIMDKIKVIVGNKVGAMAFCVFLHFVFKIFFNF